MQLNDQEFISKTFREYYQRLDVTPPDVSRREFGFGWKDKIDYRHKCFVDGKQLKEFLVKETPLYASYSLARYEFPSARPMPKKNYLGCDLVFDLDTTYQHDSHNSLYCLYCMQHVSQDAIRLKEEFLVKDFGFSEKEILLVFSGQKGFHLHVRNHAVQQLSSNARKELLDYISGKFDVSKMLLEGDEMADNVERRKAQALGPGKQSRGWSKKIFTKTLTLFQVLDAKKMREYGFNGKNITYVKENQGEAIANLENGKWDAFCAEPAEVFKKIADEIRVSTTVEIDKAVTYDTARLIRLPNSIHGSTGFAAKNMPALDPSSFDPSKQCTITQNTTRTIKASEDIAITFAEQTYELKKDAPAEVPLALALFMACKKKTVT